MTVWPNTPSADMIRAYEKYLVGFQGRSPRTVQSVLELLYRLDRDLAAMQADAGALPEGLAGARRGELVSWLAQKLDQPDEDDWSRSTKATYRSHMIGFYRWATDEEDPWLSYDPSRNLPRPHVNLGIPNPTPDEVVRICVTQACQPWRLHCILACYAGLRPIEIAELDRADINDRWMIIRHGKGDKAAILPTEPPVWRAVKDLPAGPVTRLLNGKPANRHWVSNCTSKYLQQTLGMPPGTSLRYMRHWHGTWLRRHHDLRTVQERMRHASLQTTQIYTAVTQAELLASAGALPDFTVDASDDQNDDEQ